MHDQHEEEYTEKGNVSFLNNRFGREGGGLRHLD